ncbi:MAG: hypothetical protein ACOX8Q_01060 [Christensenellales bacterium]|jgi:hypothetical protein
MQEDHSISQCADTLSSLGCTKSAEQLSIFANLLAISISKGKDADQLNVIGNFIVGIGGLILTIAAQKQSCETKQDKLKQIKNLKKKLQDLEDSLN